MDILEYDVVMEGKENDTPVLYMPITRLGNVKDATDEKSAPTDGDYLPVIDSADDSLMKKTSWTGVKAAMKEHLDQYYNKSIVTQAIAEAGTSTTVYAWTPQMVAIAAKAAVKEIITQIHPLNDYSWEQISAISEAGQGANYWNVGDCKAVTLNGTVGDLTFNNETYYCFILGFNHNSAKEGANRIHFQFGKTDLTNGTDICFIDSKYDVQGSTSAFRMNTSNTNSGGWEGSYMRTTICPAFKNVLPSDLKAVLRTVTKYSNNTGAGSTVTTDEIFLLAEFEVFGVRTNADTTEQSHQLQYDYYKNGNNKGKYRHSSTGTAAYWALRSVNSTYSVSFCGVLPGGAPGYYSASYSVGFVPAFCV